MTPIETLTRDRIASIAEGLWRIKRTRAGVTTDLWREWVGQTVKTPHAVAGMALALRIVTAPSPLPLHGPLDPSEVKQAAGLITSSLPWLSIVRLVTPLPGEDESLAEGLLGAAHWLAGGPAVHLPTLTLADRFWRFEARKLGIVPPSDDPWLEDL